MPREGQSAEAGNNTRHAILKLLKTEGPADAATLAGHLRLTAMAVRQHLYEDRKSTRLNSSHGYISYAVFCLKKQMQRESCAHRAFPAVPRGRTARASSEIR